MSVKSAALKQKNELLILTLLLIILLIVGTILYHLVEKYSLIDSVYLTSVTLTTVGYRDIVPITDAGKIFTSLYCFLGIGTFLAFTASFINAALERVR